MVDGADTGSRLSVVEHTLGPRVLAGRCTSTPARTSSASCSRAGWNPGEEPTRILELITPAGLEDLFRELGALGDDFDPGRSRRWPSATGPRSTSRARRP
jgi:hypothetical protein